MGQVSEIANYSPSASVVSDVYSIAHDAPGNILSETISVPGYTSLSGQITNGYDSLDQIATSVSTRTATGMNYSWTPAANGFQADAAGNLTTMRGQSQSFTATNNELSGTGFAYDNNGNPTTYEGHTVTWDEENRPDFGPSRTGLHFPRSARRDFASLNMTAYNGSTTLTCGWRPDGMRAWKASNGTTTYFYYDLSGMPVLEEQGGAITAVNTFGPNGLISRGTGTSNEVYYQFDERGNTITRSDNNGNVLGYHGSDTFGVQFGYDPGDNNDPYLGFGAQWGYYRDSEIVFLLLGHRIYDPGYGRFLNRDPIGYAGGINPYSYGSNSPTGLVDPSGLAPGWWDAVASWSADKVQVAKNFYNQELAGVPGGWMLAGGINTGIDLVGGLGQIPASIGQLGEGLGAYDGCHSEENAKRAWGDIGTAASLALAGLGGDLYMNRPYWRYKGPESLPTFAFNGSVADGAWPTRTRGFKAPYGTDFAGAKAGLSLPSMPDAVSPVQVPWDRWTGWGRGVKPRFGNPGGGVEYRVGGYPPGE